MIDHSHPTTRVRDEPPPRSRSRHRVRPSPLRSVLILGIGTAGVLTFILWQGDLRRRKLSMDQARSHAALLTSRMGSAGLLPLNLAPGPAPGAGNRTYRMESISRAEASRLRGGTGRIIAAYTQPIRQSLRPIGRAVVVFENKHFETIWLPLAEFDRLLADQKAAPR